MTILDFRKSIRKASWYARGYNYTNKVKWSSQSLDTFNEFLNEFVVTLLETETNCVRFSMLFSVYLKQHLKQDRGENVAFSEETFNLGYCNFLAKKHNIPEMTERLDSLIRDMISCIITLRKGGWSMIDQETLIKFKETFSEDFEKVSFTFDWGDLVVKKIVFYTLNSKSVVAHYLKKHNVKITGKAFSKINIFVNVFGKFIVRECFEICKYNHVITLLPHDVKNVTLLLMSGINVNNFMAKSSYKVFQTAKNRESGPYKSEWVEDIISYAKSITRKYVVNRNKRRKDGTTRTEKTGLIVNVAHVEKMMRSQMGEKDRLGKESSVYMACVIEKFVSKLVELFKDQTITPKLLKETYEKTKGLRVIDKQICGLELLA